jgi:hypothetical protein
VWFIFIIHFFNADLRPEKFPMDPVIFTGRISAEELREERPLEYQRLVEHGELRRIVADAPPSWLRILARVIAVSAVATGFILLVVTLIAFFRS